jgi:hypothetical protein
VTETTLEEARRCPKCQDPGRKAGESAAPLRNRDGTRKFGIEPGTMLYTYICENQRCKWYGTVCRIIQVNPDGSIPAPTTKRDKEFPARPDLVQQTQDAIDRQLRQETSDEGGEIGR